MVLGVVMVPVGLVGAGVLDEFDDLDELEEFNISSMLPTLEFSKLKFEFEVALLSSSLF